MGCPALLTLRLNMVSSVHMLKPRSRLVRSVGAQFLHLVRLPMLSTFALNSQDLKGPCQPIPVQAFLLQYLDPQQIQSLRLKR